jgi:acetyl-CoA acetyltransferase
MRDVAIVGAAQTPSVRQDSRDEVELVQSVVSRALAAAGLERDRIGFVVSGSCDFLVGRPFSFLGALDGVGAWPPMAESHVEMDGAWALYEAWIRLQHGDIDVALVYGFGRSSAGDPAAVAVAQLDPYLMGPLFPDAISLAALQARALLDSGRYTEADFAAVAARSRASAASNPHAQLREPVDVASLLAAPFAVEPLRRHDLPPISDGAAAVVLAAGDAVSDSACARPAWIRAMDHRVDSHALGWRDLTTSASTARAGRECAIGDVQVAELHAPFSFQELILRDALGLGPHVQINPSGGALCGNPIMAAGLVRIIEAAQRISGGEVDRALAHATSGPCLQQNLVAVLEGA